MKWCRLDENNFVMEVIDFDPEGKYHPDLIWQECEDDTESNDYWDGENYIKPTPPAEIDYSAIGVALQAEEVWVHDTRRRAVGATPVIADADQEEFDLWMKAVYDAQDAQVAPPEPPAFVRRVIDVPEQEEGNCTIVWHEFTGTWAGWGFKAIFRREDISSLGLKVYDENDAYLYALTFTAGDYPGEWVTETPAGFATPTKVSRAFEIIAGAAPVTELLVLNDTKEGIMFNVKWSAGDPV